MQKVWFDNLIFYDLWKYFHFSEAYHPLKIKEILFIGFRNLKWFVNWWAKSKLGYHHLLDKGMLWSGFLVENEMVKSTEKADIPSKWCL